jgi:UDP-N-acetylglucosamine 4,6-dehydratase
MGLADRSILVTGGTGSFGTKFAEIVLAKHDPRRLVVLSRDELKQHEMAQRFRDERLRFFLGDVRDRDRLLRAMDGVDLVIHAAALKQVPACEYNPFEAVKTNILGAQNVIEAAIDRGVEKVIALSTDKAVNPVNLYGATKLCAEKIFVQGNAYAGHGRTRMAVVRYGNVVGSRGSVVPTFLGQRKDGYVTLTDARMTRFWITLEQGVEFVVRCVDLMRGGEVFVPKLPSMRLPDLARVLAPAAEVRVIGIRPGEKLHELLIAEDEARHTVEYDDCYVVEPVEPRWSYAPRRDGRPLPAGFAYGSERNDAWLTADDLRAMIPAPEGA